jgi:hypothetical protein
MSTYRNDPSSCESLNRKVRLEQFKKRNPFLLIYLRMECFSIDSIICTTRWYERCRANPMRIHKWYNRSLFRNAAFGDSTLILDHHPRPSSSTIILDHHPRPSSSTIFNSMASNAARIPRLVPGLYTRILGSNLQPFLYNLAYNYLYRYTLSLKNSYIL